MEKEIRSFKIEYKVSPENRMVEGRAIPFNVFSPNREGFYEKIAPEAVEGVFEKSDILMLYNHDRERFLARNNKGKGTLKWDVRDDGVYFTFKAKNDDLSNYVYERLVSGELDETSWAFSIAEDGDIWTHRADGEWERVITRFDQLYDFSIVNNSYYGIENAVGCKRFAEVQEEDRLAFERAKAEEEAKQQEEVVEEEVEEPVEEKQEEVIETAVVEERNDEEEEKEEPQENEEDKEQHLKEYYDNLKAQYLN